MFQTCVSRSRSTPGIQDTCSRVPVLLCLVHASSLLDISLGHTFPSFPCQNFPQVVGDVSGTLFRIETAILITRRSWRCLPGYTLGCCFPNTGNQLAPAGSRSTVKIKILEIMKDRPTGSQVKKANIRCFTDSSFVMCFTE